MHATMMDYPLTLHRIVDRAERFTPREEIVSRMPGKQLRRASYAEVGRRARALAHGLVSAGLGPRDRVGTLMWNHQGHLESYFGIPLAGGVLHTLNLRLSPDEIAYIVNHAADRFVIVDDVLLPLWQKIADKVKIERLYVARLTDAPLPKGAADLETLIAAGESIDSTLPTVAEGDPLGMCYTSGTTGAPKGVVYSHRAIALHSMASALVDTLALSRRDRVLPVVPMFHANAWGIPFSAALVGAAQILPGPHLDAESLLDLFERERVTVAAGVPTIWLGILQALEREPTRWKLQPNIRMVVGGSAAPESMIRGFDKFGMTVIHAWGMTETAPLGSVSQLQPHMEGWPEAQRLAARARQGVPVPFVEVRARNEEGEVPFDGKTAGELEVRGAWVAGEYAGSPAETADRWTADGWFKTGDVVTIDEHGSLQITDRTKDLIKSGGEWVSSVALENELMGHPAVAEAAVIAVPHPKWGERPLATVVLKKGAQATPDELRTFLVERVPKMWVPDAVELIDAIPRTSTGKFLKSALRDRYKDAFSK